jgi:hypothetical protein
MGRPLPIDDAPGVQIDPSTRGGVEVGVGTASGQVYLTLSASVDWVAFTPRQARQLAELIKQKSYEAEG